MSEVVAPTRIAVVVPAHDEAAAIGACLDSVAVASERLLVHTGLTATVTVVADACSDDTTARASARGADVLAVDHRCVGLARAAGVDHVLAGLADTGVGPERVWLAMTDADSTVTPQWLVEQYDAAVEGAQLWLGDVRPDATTLPAALLHEWTRRHRARRAGALPRIFGANLGVSGDLYLRAGGFPPLDEHEDVAFVNAAVAAGGCWVAGTAGVKTSGRAEGRTPGGFAGYLRALAAELPV